jgi:hypothetical protein
VAIKEATAPAGVRDDDEVPVAASVIHRDRWNRPLIPLQSDPGGEPLPRTRSSSFGKHLEDSEGLRKWGEGIVAIGVGRSRSLQLEAAALGTQDPQSKETKAALRKLREHAYEGGGGNEGWRKGTALHRLTEVLDAGLDPGDQGEFNAVIDKYRELTAPFEIVVSEVFGANDRWLTCGTFDFLLRTRGYLAAPDGSVFEPGTVIGGDKKTSGHGAVLRGEVRGAAHDVLHRRADRQGDRAVDHLGRPGGRPDQRWGLILHIPVGPGEGRGVGVALGGPDGGRPLLRPGRGDPAVTKEHPIVAVHEDAGRRAPGGRAPGGRPVEDRGGAVGGGAEDGRPVARGGVG